MIYTQLDPRGGGTNRLYGVDLDYKPNRQSAFYLFGAASEDQGRSGDAGAFGTGYGYTARSVRAACIASIRSSCAASPTRDGGSRGAATSTSASS